MTNSLNKIDIQRRGISLMSLILIIVLLLIIAGLIMKTVLGPDGLVKKAEKDKSGKSGIEFRKVLINELNSRNKIHIEETKDKKPMFKSPQEIINIFNKKAEDLNVVIHDVSFYEISDKSKQEMENYKEENKQNLYLEKGNEISKVKEFDEKFSKGKEAFIIRVTGSKKTDEVSKEDNYRYLFEITFKPEEFVSINGDIEVLSKKNYEKKYKVVEEKKEENNTKK